MSKRKVASKTPPRRKRSPSRAASDWPADVLQWPIVRAYVPQYEAWMATGMGTAGIIRQRPDGGWATAYFWIGLFHGGIENMFGEPHSDPLKTDDLLAALGDGIPPYQEGDPDLAARYIWGAHEWSADLGYTFPKRSRHYLGLVPPLAGTRDDWLDQFIDEKTGLVPVGLQKAMHANEPPEDLPSGKEIVIFTEAEFHLADSDAAVRKLRKAKPHFVYGGTGEAGEDVFVSTREYPPNHPSATHSADSRQLIGEVRVSPGRLVATAQVLSMETRLIDRLKRQLGRHPRTEAGELAGNPRPRAVRGDVPLGSPEHRRASPARRTRAARHPRSRYSHVLENLRIAAWCSGPPKLGV